MLDELLRLITITRKDRETGKERENTFFPKGVTNIPISHLNHPTHIKTLEIMRMRFKIPLLRHFFKPGENPTISNALKSWVLCVFLHFDSNMDPYHYKQLF